MRLVLTVLMLLVIGSMTGLAWGDDWSERRGVASLDTNPLPPCVVDFQVPSLPYSHASTLVGAGNECGQRVSQDHIYALTIAHPGSYNISTCGSPVTTDVYLILSRECCGGEEVARNDDGCGAPHGPATLSCITLDAGVYYLVVEAGTPAGEGAYSLSIFECANACDLALQADGTYPTTSGGFRFVQSVSSASAAPAYEGPFTNPTPCQSGVTSYGFDYLCWYDNDFGWTHTFPAWNDANGVCVDSVRLSICAWDVDAEDCLTEHPDNPSDCERDRVYLDDAELAPQYLSGTGQTWSVTTMAVPPSIVAADGRLEVWLDMDELRTMCSFAARIKRSQIEVFYRTGADCNDPPYTPHGTMSACVAEDSSMCVRVTGPFPADPNADTVSYSYAWAVANSASGYELLPALDQADTCVPASVSHAGDVWRVEVTAVDVHGETSPEPWVEYFVVVPNCGGPNDVVGWDYGDLDTVGYHLTGTELSGGPANAIREQNLAWLGGSVTAETAPNMPDNDTGDDGVVFLHAPWQPCETVCVDVRVTAGAAYTPDVPLYLYAWKDGNLDFDFNDRLCDGTAAECLIAGAPILGLTGGRDSLYHFCFTDPGVNYLGQYNGVMRFRLLSEPAGCGAGLRMIDPRLGETEDYVLRDLQLAVELQSFAATQEGNAVAITWTTASETDNDHFIIERQANGSWERIAPRIAAAGNSANERHYQYRDEAVAAGRTYEYRLIAVTSNGTAQVIASREVTVHAVAEVVSEYQLYPNYPNPFNPSTTIAFDLKDAGHVQLQVYDVMGREVATLVNSPLTAGRHTVTFEARNLPSGVYLYRLTTPGYADMRKMILLK